MRGNLKKKKEISAEDRGCKECGRKKERERREQWGKCLKDQEPIQTPAPVS